MNHKTLQDLMYALIALELLTAQSHRDGICDIINLVHLNSPLYNPADVPPSLYCDNALACAVEGFFGAMKMLNIDLQWHGNLVAVLANTINDQCHKHEEVYASRR